VITESRWKAQLPRRRHDRRYTLHTQAQLWHDRRYHLRIDAFRQGCRPTAIVHRNRSTDTAALGMVASAMAAILAPQYLQLRSTYCYSTVPTAPQYLSVLSSTHSSAVSIATPQYLQLRSTYRYSTVPIATPQYPQLRSIYCYSTVPIATPQYLQLRSTYRYSACEVP
jgi:hypothetical protein